METLPTPARIRRDDNKYIGDVPKTETLEMSRTPGPSSPRPALRGEDMKGAETSEMILTQLDTRTTA